MKKILTLFALVLLGCMGAWAAEVQITRTTNFSALSANREVYFKMQEAAKYFNGTRLVDACTNDCWFTLVASGSNFKFKNRNDQYVKVTLGHNPDGSGSSSFEMVSNMDDATEFAFSSSNGGQSGFKIIVRCSENHSGYHCLLNSNSTLDTYQYSSDGSWKFVGWYAYYDDTPPNSVDVTYHITATNNGSDEITFDVTKQCTVGSTASVSDINFDYFSNLNITDANKTISETNNSFNVTADHTMPMVPGKYYKLSVVGKNFVNYVSATEANITANFVADNSKFLWYIISKGDGTFWLCNKFNDKAVVAKNNSAAAVDFLDPSGTTKAYEFVAGTGGFKLFEFGTTWNMGAHGTSGSTPNAALGRWDVESRSSGAVFVPEEVEITPDWDGLQTIIEEAESYPLGEGLGKYRYMYNGLDFTDGMFTPMLEAMKEDYDNREHSTTDYDGVEDYKTDLRAMIDALSINQPAAGKFYLFQGAHPGNQKYMELTPQDGSSNAIKFSADAPTAYSYIYIDGTVGNFTMLGFGNGLYAKSEFQVAAAGETAGTVTFGKMIDKTNSKPIIGQYCIEDNTTHRWGHPWDHGYVQPKDEASQFDDYGGWLITEATSLPVTISAAGYATFNCPVAVNIPANVHAYTGTINGNVLTLTEVENVIPANTPVVLKGAADTYNFPISNSTAAAIDNALTGTVAAIAAPSNVLTLQNIDGVGFYTFDGASLRGFSAYIAGAGSNLRIAFDEITGINAIDASIAGGNIYDLTGRRVNTIQKGQIYVKNGKKFMF